VPPAAESRIPLHAHFIWFGAALPYVYRLALRSAAQNGGFQRVTLHCEPALLAARVAEEFADDPRIAFRTIDETAFAHCPDPQRMAALFGSLTTPAARANVLRIAILHDEGGVYLDTDTVTLRSFATLCERNDMFCGSEHIVFPASVRASSSLRTRALAQVRGGVRKLLTLPPNGYRLFQRIADWYPTAVNNAVLGAAPRHAVLVDMMDAMLRLSESARNVRFALGTHLLQRTVAMHTDVQVYPPRYFYPLGPEVSVHWFKRRKDVRLDHVLSEDTICVHWYASVKTRDVVQRIDREYIGAHANSQLYSALVTQYMQLGGRDY
jgi:hypothetical protein